MTEIKQRSPEWFEQRKGRITGSRIGTILGVNPWQKPIEVIRAMVREYHGYPTEFKGNIATEHGNKHEQRALLAFMRETGLHVTECGFFPFGNLLGASPDGITSDDATLELKVPFSLRNGGEFKSLADQPHYYHQVMMEMHCTSKKHAYFAQYIAPKGDPLDFDYVPEQIKIEHVEYDQEWFNSINSDLDRFYRWYLDELDNKEHLEPLREMIDDSQSEQIINEIMAIRARKKEDEAREKELLSDLVQIAGEKDAEIHGHKLTKVTRKGSTNWRKIATEFMPKDLDLEKYCGNDVFYWRLSDVQKS